MVWVDTAHCSRGPLPRLPSPSSPLLTNCHQCPLAPLSSKYTTSIISISYEVFLVSIRDLHPSDFGFRYPGNRKFCTAPNRIAEPEDTLVSVRAPVGDINMAWERCCIGRGIASLRYRACAASFTYYTVQALQVRLREYENTGTVFGAITRTQLARLPIQQPSMELVHAFECLARGWDETIRRNTAQINTLTALRSVLLPRLVSGRLRTKYPMRFIGRTI